MEIPYTQSQEYEGGGLIHVIPCRARYLMHGRTTRLSLYRERPLRREGGIPKNFLGTSLSKIFRSGALAPVMDAVAAAKNARVVDMHRRFPLHCVFDAIPSQLLLLQRKNISSDLAARGTCFAANIKRFQHLSAFFSDFPPFSSIF